MIVGLGLILLTRHNIVFILSRPFNINNYIIKIYDKLEAPTANEGGDLAGQKVIGFTCRWSHKDLEERARALSDDDVRIFQLNCLANLTTSTLMNAFSEGADVVFLLGCGGPLCKYYDGWVKIDRVAKSLELMLQDMGLETERLILSSCDEKAQDPLGKTAQEAIKRAKDLGPSPYRASGQ